MKRKPTQTNISQFFKKKSLSENESVSEVSENGVEEANDNQSASTATSGEHSYKEKQD